MGYYLNSIEPYTLYRETAESPYFVDKSMMIADLLKLINTRDKHICITRPRRFGKSVMADMIGAFFTKGIDSSCIFNKLKISAHPMYREYLNRYNVIYINFLKAANESESYKEFIAMVKNTIQGDVRKAFRSVEFLTGGTAIQDLTAVTEQTGEKFGTYFGFTREEVDTLYEEYLANEKEPDISREDLDYWYDGYSTVKGIHIYNPRSLVCALSDNQIDSYWTETGSFSEIAGYIASDVDGVKSAVAQMVAGESVPVMMQEYAVTAKRLDTKDRILSAMVIYGFLTYDENTKTVRIPNKELMDEFNNTIREETGIGYINRLARASDAILQATLDMDAAAVAEALAAVHKDRPIMAYNSEAELCTVVYFAYLSALDTYEVKREEQAGKGYADFIFMPRDRKKDGIIIELKKDKTPDEAIQQIKDKHYIDSFRGRLGETQWHGNRVLAVDITYDSKSREHQCRIEEMAME